MLLPDLSARACTTRITAASSTIACAVLMVIAGLSSASSAAAHEEHVPTDFRGLINDYTPSGVTGGPYEMHGKWRLELNEYRGTANFTAEMSMETADFASAAGQANPGALSPHTHHFSMTHATISYDTTSCPSALAPTPLTTTGFVVTGLVHITGNGQPAPFEITQGTTQLTPSSLTICVTGGSHVEFSNITLVLGTPAAKHFGTQAIHGVVVKCNRAWAHESGDCALED
jgi:hypothetical protein